MKKSLFLIILFLLSAVGMRADYGKLSHAFSVSSTKQVYFSAGNLQYRASDDSWRFAEHQYDVIGDNPGNTTDYSRDSQSGWIDLFGWGTGDEPWKSSTYNGDYESYTEWGSQFDTESGWRTLTYDELMYVLYERFGYPSTGMSFAKGTVNGIEGLILLPDDWSTSYYLLSSTDSRYASCSSNIITLSDWTTYLEANGAVFLPVTGYRSDAMVEGLQFGNYWTSTPYGSYYAYSLAFDGTDLMVTDTQPHYGIAVRLVSETSGSGSAASCGDNLTWVYDEVSYTLTISGTGAMYDFDANPSAEPGECYYDVPWKDYWHEIENVVIGEGVTTIGAHAFYGHNYVSSVSLPSTLTSIGEEAFYSCNYLSSIDLPISLQSIASGALDSYSLTNITVHWTSFAGLTVHQYAFGYSPSGKTLHTPSGVEIKRLYKTTTPWSSMSIDGVYNISYTLNGGTVSPANPTYYITGDNAITLTNPTKSGSLFLGWTGSNGSTPQSTVTIASAATGNKSYTANWKASHTVSLQTGTDDAANWSFTSSPAYEGVEVTINYGGSKEVESISLRRQCANAYEINSTNIDDAVNDYNNHSSSRLLFTEDLVDGNPTLRLTAAAGEVDLNGHQVFNLYVSNNTLESSVVVRNGTVTHELDGTNGWGDWFRGTVILENVNVPVAMYTDGHHYIINGGTYNRIENYRYSGSGYPNTVIIYDGRFSVFDQNIHDWNWLYSRHGSYTLYGGKYAFNPSTSPNGTNITIPTGYAVQSNTDDDAATYPYKVVNTDPAKAVAYGSCELTEVVSGSQWTFNMPWYNVEAVVEYAPDNVVLTAYQDPQHPSDYYCTFFDGSHKYTLPAGTEAYTATRSGDALNLTKFAEGGQVIPANNAVIFKTNSSSITLTPSDASAVSTGTNSLQGTDAAISNPDYGNVYVLSGQGGEVGFFRLASGATIPAHKAYVVIPGGVAGAPKKLRFVFEGTQGVEQPTSGSSLKGGEKIFRDGILYIKHGEHLYNAQGQTVK